MTQTNKHLATAEKPTRCSASSVLFLSAGGGVYLGGKMITTEEIKEASIKLPLYFDREIDAIYDQEGRFLEPSGKTYYQPRIDYVVKACNMHDDLVSALKEAHDALVTLNAFSDNFDKNTISSALFSVKNVLNKEAK
jgi:hypothetical protein